MMYDVTGSIQFNFIDIAAVTIKTESTSFKDSQRKNPIKLEEALSILLETMRITTFKNNPLGFVHIS